MTDTEQKLMEEIKELKESFKEERRFYMKSMRDLIWHFVGNEEQIEAIQADFQRLIKKGESNE